MLLSEKNKTSFIEAIREKILDPAQIEAKCEELRSENKTVVTLNGSFDLLHPGHLEIMYQASLQGDVLLMLLNSDASIQRYKAKDRPINPLQVRMQLIAALAMVDFVSYFEEDDPCSMLDRIRPDVHINGSDYSEDCLEAPVVKKHGGRIHLVELVPGFSSTNILNKVRKS